MDKVSELGRVQSPRDKKSVKLDEEIGLRKLSVTAAIRCFELLNVSDRELPESGGGGSRKKSRKEHRNP